MILGRDDEVDGDYVGTVLTALVVPTGARYVGAKASVPVRSSARALAIAAGRIWLPVLALAWPALLGWTTHAFIEAVLLGAVAALLHRPQTIPEAEKRALRVLGTQTGLRIAPDRLLPATRKAKLDMLGGLMAKGGLAADPEWLLSVLDEIPPPALPLVYAYARYASDEPPWSTFASTILQRLAQLEQDDR